MRIRFFASLLLCFLLSAMCHPLLAQKQALREELSAYCLSEENAYFSGNLLLTQGNREIYSFSGYAAEATIAEKIDGKSQFVIGSISKQFTAVICLWAYQEGKISLDEPIATYLPNLSEMPWLYKVNLRHLLSHCHGIVALDAPANFEAGTSFSYSQLGYELLAKLLEARTGCSFQDLANAFFKRHGMHSTLHTDKKPSNDLLKGYTAGADGKLLPETASFENYVAAGGFVSTAKDLHRWDQRLWSGKILHDSLLKYLKTPVPKALRNHPFFGETQYALGTTVDTREGILQIGQTGFAPGYASLHFYFPEYDVSLTVLGNTVLYPDELIKSFRTQLDCLAIVRKHLKGLKKKASL